MQQPTCPYRLDPTGNDLHREAARLRDQGPVTRVVLPGEVEAWLITDPELLRTLFTDPRVSKDAYQHWPRFEEMPSDWSLHLWVSVRNMFTANGAEHRRLRSLVAPAFTARRIRALRPQIERITAELLDELATTPPGAEVDLREGFAYPLPLEVINSLLGIADPQARADLRQSIAAIFSTSLPPHETAVEIERFYAVLGDVLDQKRHTPGDDLTSTLLSTRDEDGSRLSEEELVDTLGLMVAAGHETTVNLLDHALVVLLTRPELRERIGTGELSWAAVIEETLRWQPPLANLPMRFAIEDLTLPGGTTIAAGEPILAGLLAANRHPDHHADADEFDPTRQDTGHLAFGHGPHYCLGAPMARLEAEIALPAIFARFPDLALAADLAPAGDSFIANAHRALPVVPRPVR